MSTINYTYNVIVDRFRQFAAGHFQLRRFTHGEISQADLEKEAEWPWLHVKPRAINYSPGTRSFSFEIFISDLPRDKEDKTGYQAESITDCSLIFQDLINEIYLGNMFGDQVVLSRPVNSEPFVEQYTHTLTGVTGIVELNLDYDWSACSIPASWNYNTPTDSPSDGWGALQFIESLDQNGVYVSLLNDVEAPGNSYYYGTDAEGVKGWYAIVDNIGLTCETLPDCATIISIIEDIAALQTDVALKANIADLGATAFSNSYNDLDDKPSIPSIAGLATVTYVDQQDALKVDKVAGKGLSTEDYTTAEKTKLAGIQDGAEVNVNADWNAVSGDAQILNKPTIPSIAGLVPETRTLTINGTTQDLSANRTFTIATGLTVGTTPITSGAVGRVLFEGTGNVLQESANLFWNNTNNRLGINTSTPASALQVVGTLNATNVQSPFIFTTGTDQLVFATQGGTSAVTIFPTSRNVLIQNGGTAVDAGFKLDVNGTVRVSGDVQFGLVGAAQTNFRFNAGTGGGQGYASIYGSGATGIYFGLGSSTNGLSGTGINICRAYINELGNNCYGFVGLDNTLPMTFRFGGFGSSVEALRLTNTQVTAAQKLVVSASTTTRSSMNIPSGTAPTTPVNGDIWFDGTNIQMRIGGVTKTFTLI